VLDVKKALKKYKTKIISDGCIKFSGDFAKAIAAEPEKYFTPEILDKLNEYAKKVFLYGGFDEAE